MPSSFEKTRRLAVLASAFLSLTLATAARAQEDAGAPSEKPPAWVQTPLPPTGSAAPASSAPPAPKPGDCFPACREGFVCSEARCVSVCNPPCPSDQVCVEGRSCEYGPPASGAVHEPLPPRRVPFEEKNFSMIAFHYGFPSDVEKRGTSGLHGPALGVNMRSDVPVASYLLVGPMFEFASYEPGYYFDLDFYLRARVPIDTKPVQFQIWAGVPIGLTFSFLSGPPARDLDGFALGWNVGVLLGGAAHFSREFGLFTELGWQQQKMSHDRVVRDRASGGTVLFVAKPWIWNIGFVFRG